MLMRPAELRDVEALKALRHAAFAKHAPSAYSPEEVENLLNGLDEEELLAMITARQMFVGEVDGVLVGCAGWRGANLRHVYVRLGRERAGVGTRLVASAESDYRDRTVATEMHLGCGVYARTFYEAVGYRLVTRDRDWDGSELLRMTKSLDRGA
jgi:GNAT superfamily N-acetyltransferase